MEGKLGTLRFHVDDRVIELKVGRWNTGLSELFGYRGKVGLYFIDMYAPYPYFQFGVIQMEEFDIIKAIVREPRKAVPFCFYAKSGEKIEGGLLSVSTEKDRITVGMLERQYKRFKENGGLANGVD